MGRGREEGIKGEREIFHNVQQFLGEEKGERLMRTCMSQLHLCYFGWACIVVNLKLVRFTHLFFCAFTSESTVKSS